MKFLIDNNISHRICPHLEAAGHEAVHVEALSMADAVQARDRPKLDRYEDHQFVSLMTLRSQDPAAHLAVGRVMVFLGDAFVVTVRQEDGDTLERARDRLERLSAMSRRTKRTTCTRSPVNCCPWSTPCSR